LPGARRLTCRRHERARKPHSHDPRRQPVAAAALAEASAAAARAAVKRQLDTGIDVVNNGEQGRESFFT